MAPKLVVNLKFGVTHAAGNIHYARLLPCCEEILRGLFHGCNEQPWLLSSADFDLLLCLSTDTCQAQSATEARPWIPGYAQQSNTYAVQASGAEA